MFYEVHIMNKIFKEFHLGGEQGLFTIKTPKKKFNANTLSFGGKYPYVIRSNSNNGIRGYITQDEKYLNDGNTISFGQDTATIFYQKDPYFTGDKIKILTLKEGQLNKNIGLYFITVMRKSFSNFSWGSSSFDEDVLSEVMISLPVDDNGNIDFKYMEERISELEEERISELTAYLAVSGLENYILTEQEQDAINKFNNNQLEWNTFNVKDLFGESTRGKRLKSLDRIAGDLPFVTAGEENEGISAYIGNNVHVFSENTSTIDMFGSAKYRNYKYGADDHVAVVHTENIPKYAAMFITTALHKAAHTGQFDYSRNFYAKDADALMISLPAKNSKPDYDYMELFMKATQKNVIKDLIEWKDKIINETRQVVRG